MNPATLSSPPAAEIRKACHAVWTPPEWLFEISSGDDGLMAELIDVFRTATESSLGQMRVALAAGDIARLRAEAHRTKGSARQVGAASLAEVCQALELESGIMGTTRFRELVDRVQELFEETAAEMAPYCGTHGASHYGAPRFG